MMVKNYSLISNNYKYCKFWIYSVIYEYIVSGQLFQQLKLKKVQKRIEKLEGHTIICGLVERKASYDQASKL